MDRQHNGEANSRIELLAGFVGTDEQKALQARAEASVAEIASTPGLCQNGRMLGCDDIDALGWPSVYDILERDGFIGFRLLPADRTTEVSAKLSEKGFRLDTWDLFVGAKEDALPVCEEIVARPLPSDLQLLSMPDQPEGGYTLNVQSLIASTGIVPFSGSFLVGSLGPATTVVVGKSTDDLAAAAHGYLPHNAYSRYRHHAWGGLVAVADSYRGQGLGRFTNALLAVAVFRDLEASHIYEMISRSNVQSRRMAEACGLRHDPSFLCGSAARSDRERFTR